MKTAERKIICKLLTGSKLYGTHRPESDDDYVGVFLPGLRDLLSLQNCPTEMSESIKKSEGDRNAKGDVDCKYYSLQRFFNLAAQGQPAQLEMLFVPKHAQLYVTPEWEEVVSNRSLFMSKSGITPFIGFALAQAHKATIKGENYNKIKALLEWGAQKTAADQLFPIGGYLHWDGPIGGERTCYLGGQVVKFFTNEHGYDMIELAGRDYDVGLKLKTFLSNIQTLMDRYGSRSKAAAEVGNDLKSYLHAYRLLGEAKEYLLTGNITMPRPDAEFLKTIRSGEYQADFYQEITDRITEIRQQVEPKCYLPKAPDYKNIEQLCQKMLYTHLFGKL